MINYEIEGLKIEIIDEIFSANYPILYILEDEIGNLFLGLNHTRSDTIIVRTGKKQILSLLKDEFPIRFYFENKKEYWTNENSTLKKLNSSKTLENLLPDKEDYLEVELGEFDELIEKYSF